MQEENAHIWTEQSMDGPVSLSLGRTSAVVFSRAKQPGETANQDALAVLSLNQEHHVLAVADGAGGMPSGSRAAALAVQQLANAIRKAADSETQVQYGVMKGFESANQAILEMGVGAATTLTVAEISRDSLKVFHTGDSGILVTGQRGSIKLQTISHSPVGYALEAGLLSEREALRHEDLNLVSNLLGAQDMRFDVGPVLELKPFDTVVIGTDGLFDNLHGEEIVSIVRCGSMMKAAQKLAEAALSRMRDPNAGRPGKLDDISFILYRPRGG
jgi:serine/threonine protein phosphatase PrpC